MFFLTEFKIIILNNSQEFKMSEVQDSLDRDINQEQEGEQMSSDAAKIASELGTKQYFLTEQGRNLDQWADNASQIMRFAAQVMTSEYQFKSGALLEDYSQHFDQNYSRCKKEFDAFCILNRKVQKKNDEIENLANHLNRKNTKKNYFNAWKAYSDKKKYIRKMDERSEKYHNHRIMKNVLKCWLDMTMDNNKTKIKNDVLQKTEMQVSRIQVEYERLIKTLQQSLQKKLTDLKKQEQEHKMLHDKYETMYSRARMQEPAA